MIKSNKTCFIKDILYNNVSLDFNEAAKQIKEVFNADEVKIDVTYDNNLSIKITKIHECMKINYNLLKKVSKIVGSENINVGDEYFDSSYESKRTIELYVLV